jgi:two-component system chemotaxis response regulator CheB
MFSSRTERGAKTATDALLLGAKDFVFKPGGARMADLEAGRRAIVDEIAPRLRWLTRRSSVVPVKTIVASRSDAVSRIDLVVVAASTGGPAALATVMRDPTLRLALSTPILIVQHMPAMFTKHLASRLASDCGLDIAEATEEEELKPGMIRIAPGGRHLAVTRRGMGLATVVHDGPAVNSCRPSADVLFLSAAEIVKSRLLAVMLTGMGRDGRDGCRAIHTAGGWIVAQDEASSVVWGMPGSVVKEGLADQVVPLEKIGSQLARFLRIGRP